MLIFVLLFFEICLFMIASLVTRGDIFRPGLLMIAMFILSTSIAALNINEWNIDYSSKTVLIVVAGLFCACLVEVLSSASSMGVLRARGDIPVDQDVPFPVLEVKPSVIFLCILAELLTIYLYRQEIIRLATLDGYVEGTNLLWHFRNITSYQAEETLSMTISILVKLVDALGYIFGFFIIRNYIAGERRFHKLLGLAIPIVLFAVKVLMGSGRQELLRWTVFILIIDYIILNYKHKWRRQLSMKFVSRALVIIPIIFILFYLATNVIGRSTSRSMYDYICTYAGGSIQHFNQYIMDPSPDMESHFGAETFPGIYSFLKSIRFSDYARSVHLEMRQLGETQGNVYTFFRRPYHDFGLFGMCVMTVCIVGFFSRWYQRIKARVHMTKSSEISMLLYSYLVYWILLASIENYAIGIISLSSFYTIVMIYVLYTGIRSFGVRTLRIPGYGSLHAMQRGPSSELS